jgi:hypothetical protein
LREKVRSLPEFWRISVTMRACMRELFSIATRLEPSLTYEMVNGQMVVADSGLPEALKLPAVGMLVLGTLFVVARILWPHLSARVFVVGLLGLSAGLATLITGYFAFVVAAMLIIMLIYLLNMLIDLFVRLAERRPEV